VGGGGAPQLHVKYGAKRGIWFHINISKLQFMQHRKHITETKR
jgi:hypothetical protein